MEKTIFNKQVKVTAESIPGLAIGFGVDRNISSKSYGVLLGFFCITLKIYSRNTL